MAETWEIILWVIVAAAIVILIVVAIATALACRRRNRRKKNVKHRRFEWERKDETDYGKRKVYYDASNGQAKILDQTDSGEISSQKTKVEYNAKREEARILGLGDNIRGLGDKKLAESGVTSSGTDVPRFEKANDYQSSSHFSKESRSFSEESFQTKETEVKNVSRDESKDDYVRLQSAPVRRERLQPLEAVPRQTAMTSQTAVNSYTNLGYSQAGQNKDVISNVKFQQPVAVIRAFVHPDNNANLRQARSLPRNHSKLNYKKSITTSTTPRRKPVLYTWSLNAADSKTPHPWATLPLTYQEIPSYANRRRAAKHRSSIRSRSFTKRSLRKEKDKRIGSLNGVYITDSPPRKTYQQNARTSTYYEKSRIPDDSHFAPRIDKLKRTHAPQEISSNDRKNYGDFYEEYYKMVKRSEFPAFKSSSSRYESSKSREIEPEISSIVSGSEFSDFLPVPPRPSESQSDGSTEGYSRGSYKAYKSRLEKSSKGRREMISDSTSEQDRAKHTKSFQETLESLRNGDRKDQYSVQHEESSTSKATSPWINNDRNFRKQHGVPISGVPVLPPEPVYIKMEDSDQSDNESRKREETE